MKTGEILDKFCDAVAAVLPDHFSDACCLNASRVAIEVLKKFRIEARPVSVNLRAWNGTWDALARAKGGWPDGKAESDAWAAQGGYALGIDVENMEPRANAWPGHLIVTAKGYLIDTSAGQVSRPQHRIVVPHVFGGQIVEGFLDGKRPLVYDLENDAKLAYYARPEDRSFLDVPGFQRSPHNLEAAKAVIDYMEHGAWRPVLFYGGR